MSPVMIDLLLNALWETVIMTAISGLFSLIAVLPLGLILVMTSPGGIAEHRGVNCVLGLIINGFRSLPFIILLVALIPFTRFLVGTSLGTWAAIVPLSITATPYFARVAEVSLRDVDRGLIDAVRAMGASKLRIVWDVLIPEALPGILAGFVVALTGAGGLGDLAIRYGYQRFDTTVMVAVAGLSPASVGLIATQGTLDAGWFQQHFARHDIETLLPTASEIADYFVPGCYAVKRGEVTAGAGLYRSAAGATRHWLAAAARRYRSGRGDGGGVRPTLATIDYC